MRLIKTFTLAALATVAAMAFVGATSASAVSTQLCSVHTGLTCGAGNAVTAVHQVLAAGTVLELLAPVDILCLGDLVQATAGALSSGATKQAITSVTQIFTGCGTNSAHDNCTVGMTAGQQPLFGLLKSGLDAGTLTAGSGEVRLQCPFQDCLYNLAGMEFSVGAGHLSAEETVIHESGGKWLCSDEVLWDALLETLTNTYVLG